MKDLIGLILAILILFGGCGTDSPGEAETEKEYAVAVSDVKIEMHALAAPVLDALGEPMGYTEETSCAFDGLDKTYYFGSFYLTTYPDGDTDRIRSLWFADDTVTTEEGIRIGDTLDEVRTAYGEESLDGSNAVILEGERSTLTILLNEEKVTSIQYEAKLS